MKQKAFVRYTKQGKIIPGSLIVTTKGGYPRDGLYREVSVNLCCDTTPLLANCIEFIVNTTVSTYFEFDFTTTTPINFTVDWGDGTTHVDSGAGGFYQETHTYPESNRNYTVRCCFDNIASVIELNFTGDD